MLSTRIHGIHWIGLIHWVRWIHRQIKERCFYRWLLRWIMLGRLILQWLIWQIARRRWLWLWLWLRVLWWKLEVTRRLLTRNLCKFFEKDITLRKLVFQASKFAYCRLRCILGRGLQNVDLVISCRSSTCCRCLQRIDAQRRRGTAAKRSSPGPDQIGRIMREPGAGLGTKEQT